MVKTVAALFLCSSGCIWRPYGGVNTDPASQGVSFTQEVVQVAVDMEVQPDPVQSKAYFVCVGMEKSARFGECPGCELDATRLSRMFRNTYGYEGKVLVSEQATKANVVSALDEAISKAGENDLVLFCYSGHGGQERMYGGEPDDADLSDEFLCLYDTYMLDDEIWDLVLKCKGRIFLYFDACHSATMYRSIYSTMTAKDIGMSKKGGKGPLKFPLSAKTKGFTFRIRGSAMSAAIGAANVRMMCWSGCEEKEYSYGSDVGGLMTRALVSKWKEGKKYSELWEDVRRSVISAEPTQHPVCTTIGGGFDVEAFR